MIKVGIVGCKDLYSAELVRILINHPDVDLMWVCDAECAERRLDDVVPGIVGECDLTVQRDCPLNEVNLIYLCGNRQEVCARLGSLDIPEDVNVIDMSGSHNLDHGEEKAWRYGMSEMQRRLLVHGSRMVTVPGNAAAVSLLALMPLARNLMLNSPLELHVTMGAGALPDEGKTIDGMSVEAWARDQQQEVAMVLGMCQSSFSQPVTMSITSVTEPRALAVEARFRCGVDEDTIRQLYEQYYEDHNFVFMVDRPITIADVENTNKCLIRIVKDEGSGEVTIHAVTDALLKGCAGNAVHAMNLLYGLHEKAGLALKGSGC